MNQQEWIEYFELVNGRKPTPAELAQAQAAGEFILERPNVFGSNGQVTEQRPIKPAEPVITMTQQPQFAQTTATFQQVVPAKKGMSKKTKIILASVFGSLAAILLIVGGYSLWRYQSGKIADGTYEVVSFSYYNEDKNRPLPHMFHPQSYLTDNAIMNSHQQKVKSLPQHPRLTPK